MKCQVFSFPLGLTMSIAAAWEQCLAFFGTPLVIELSPGQLWQNYPNRGHQAGSCLGLKR